MLASNCFGISHNIAFQIEIRKHLHRIGHWLKELSKKHKKADINVDYVRKVRQLKQSKKVKLTVGLKTLEDNYQNAGTFKIFNSNNQNAYINPSIRVQFSFQSAIHNKKKKEILT